MRTTKRFTAATIARFERQHRSEGTHDQYVAFHKVSRGDPASVGGSHILKDEGRLRDFLSDGELDVYYFSRLLRNREDCVEQLRLDSHTAEHLLKRYGPHEGLYPGTVEIAEELGIKHPRLKGVSPPEIWPMTSDVVLILRDGRTLKIVAIQRKPNAGFHHHRRTRELLLIEREYWVRRHGEWLLLTPAESDPSVVDTLRRTAPWGLGPPVSDSDRKIAAEVARANQGCALQEVLRAIAVRLGALEGAQRAFWQAIWRSELTLDLTIGWRPHLPICLVSRKEFDLFNPILARRSAWTSP